MKKKIIIALVVLAVLGAIGFIVAYKMWNTPHRDIQSEPADFNMDGSALIAEFAKDAAAANKKYSEKVIEFSAEVQKITVGDSLTSVLFKGTDTYDILCEMLPEHKDLKGKAEVGKTVRVKAFYQGFIEGEVDFGMPGDVLFKKGIVVE